MLISCCKSSAIWLPGGGGPSGFSKAVKEEEGGQVVGSRCALSLGCPLGAPLGTPLLTFREEHGVQPQAAPALQAGGQLGEVVAVEVEDDLQRLPAALNVVEDIGVCGRTWWVRAGDHPGPGEPCLP